MDFAQELIRRQHNLPAFRTKVGGEIFHNFRHILRAEFDILITSRQSHEQFLIFRMHEFL